MGFYGNYYVDDQQILDIETRATNLETRATNLETRATNLETRATNLEKRATNLEELIDETVYTSEVQTENS